VAAWHQNNVMVFDGHGFIQRAIFGINPYTQSNDL
jgi:polyisoprenoid-binding protein YceI